VILVGDDGGPGGEDALALGEMLAHVTGATVTQTRLPKGHSLPHALHREAERSGCDLLVVGSSHRTGMNRVVSGSVTERLLHGAPCAVAVAPRGYRDEAPREPRVIVVGFDGMPESRNALAAATRLAEQSGAALRVVAVDDAGGVGPATPVAGFGSPVPVAPITTREALEQSLQAAVEQLPRGVRPAASVVRGSAVGQLVDAADTGADLLVVGSRGRGPIRRAVLGGVSARLVRDAPCPVLVLPRSARSA
jgi:nucleotide-binding universal stress UspA family protein